MDEVRITLRIPAELHTLLKQQAQSDGQSMNEAIVYALTRYFGVIDDQERRLAKLEKFAAQVEEWFKSQSPPP